MYYTKTCNFLECSLKIVNSPSVYKTHIFEHEARYSFSILSLIKTQNSEIHYLAVPKYRLQYDQLSPMYIIYALQKTMDKRMFQFFIVNLVLLVVECAGNHKSCSDVRLNLQTHNNKGLDMCNVNCCGLINPSVND